MPLDPRIELALGLLPPMDRSGTPAERRARGLGAGPVIPHAETVPLDEECDVVVPSAWGGVPVRVYRPHAGTLPGLIWIHGGGWWTGSLDLEDRGCRQRARLAGCVIVSIDYRLAPEHPFPSALDDCWAVATWVADNAGELGIDPARLAISGGSAGANLAAAVTLLARDAGGPHFVGQVLEVPATDLTLAAGARSIDECAEGYFLTKQDLIECRDFYVGDADPSDWRISPLLADLHDLPPALVMTSEYDPVRDDGEAYAAKLATAGVPVTMRRWDGMVHGSAGLEVVVPEIAAEYNAMVKEFLDRVFG
ncbi:MAG TPA: alpha/beta hydrolase [Mycobacteriales bacterium]|nr:alpha/beta hydrolase [Mycobacteriales bacterium]